jgi:hypothetical protein
MRVQHIILVGLFRSLSFVLQAMAIVHVHSCHVHMWGVPFISKQAGSGGEIFVVSDLGSSVFLLGYLYSIENGLGNKAEVTFIAHCVLTAWVRRIHALLERFIHPASIRFHFFFFSVSWQLLRWCSAAHVYLSGVVVISLIVIIKISVHLFYIRCDCCLGNNLSSKCTSFMTWQQYQL